MGANSLPETVTRQRRGCDLNPGCSVPESSTRTTRLRSHPLCALACIYLYLVLDDIGLDKQMLLHAPLCTVSQEILEVIYWTCRIHSSWKTVRNIHNTLTEKKLGWMSVLVTTEVVVTFVTFEKSSIFTFSLPVTTLKVSVKSRDSSLSWC